MERPISSGTHSNCSTAKKVGQKTNNILISLMKEVNLNQRMQNKLLKCVNAGEPIPFLPKNLIEPNKIEKPTIHKKSISIKLPPKPIQRSKKQIELSGIYNVERYRPNPSKTRPPKEKERLQNIMAFGEDIDKEKRLSLKDKTDSPEDSMDLFDEILLEIKEREEFIEEMRDLGLAKKYLPEIQSQIAVRLKELEKLDELRARNVTSELY